MAPNGASAAPTETPADRSPVRVGAVLLHVLGFALLAAAWTGLVWLAIDAGRSARDGDGLSWLWLALASLGAVACLAAAFTVAVRTVRLLRGGAPRRTGGRHRA